jgi:hypothetical protein
MYLQDNKCNAFGSDGDNYLGGIPGEAPHTHTHKTGRIHSRSSIRSRKQKIANTLLKAFGDIRDFFFIYNYGTVSYSL